MNGGRRGEDESLKGLVTIARGKTYDARQLLGDEGFRWNGKTWSRKPALDAHRLEVLSRKLRRLGLGLEIEIRNIKEAYLEEA